MFYHNLNLVLPAGHLYNKIGKAEDQAPNPGGPLMMSPLQLLIISCNYLQPPVACITS